MNPLAPDAITEKIHAALRPHLRLLEPDQPIPPATDLGQLGLDSMGAIDLLLALEQAFGVKVPDSLLTAETFETAAALEQAVRPLVQQP